MSTVITRKVDGYGPYAYAVEYRDGDHHWRYLGRADEIDVDELDADQLSLDELAQLVNDGDGDDPGPVETMDVEFHTRDAANALRDRIDDEWLAEDDDRRSKTVEIRDDAPLSVQNIATGAAADSKAHLADQGGQVPLTDAEKREIDFTRTNVMHARSVKGRMQNAGVDDWLAFYDPSIGVEEHDPDRAKRDERGARADADATRADQLQREAQAFQTAESEAEDHARQGCIDGHEEACAELKRLGWSDAEITELEQYAEPETFARVVNDERKRAQTAAAA